MARADLERSWTITTAHLEAARALLPASVLPGPDGGSVAQYLQFLEHNELELALDQLADVGLTNSVPIEFWRRLHKAAANMGLKEHMARYQQKLEDR